MCRGVGNVGDAVREKDGRVVRSREYICRRDYCENVEGQNDELLIALDAMFTMTTDLTTAEPLT